VSRRKGFFCVVFYQMLAGARNFPPDFIRGFHKSPRFKGLEPLDSISGSIKKITFQSSRYLMHLKDKPSHWHFHKKREKWNCKPYN
jgi:hypothetical protein